MFILRKTRETRFYSSRVNVALCLSCRVKMLTDTSMYYSSFLIKQYVNCLSLGNFYLKAQMYRFRYRQSSNRHSASQEEKCTRHNTFLTRETSEGEKGRPSEYPVGCMVTAKCSVDGIIHAGQVLEKFDGDRYLVSFPFELGKLILPRSHICGTFGEGNNEC